MRRCEFSELPADQCACDHCKPKVNEYFGTGLDYAFTAKFDSTADCGHHVHADDFIARSVDGEVLCSSCANEVSR